jgi:hypothetical protein
MSNLTYVYFTSTSNIGSTKMFVKSTCPTKNYREKFTIVKSVSYKGTIGTWIGPAISCRAFVGAQPQRVVSAGPRPVVDQQLPARRVHPFLRILAKPVRALLR